MRWKFYNALLATAFVFTSGAQAVAGEAIADTFFGPAPLETIDGSIQLLEKGDVKTPFLTRKVKHKRTGELASDIEFGHTWGGVTLAAGTKLYAIPYIDHFGVIGGIKKARADETLANVAWCNPYLKKDSQDMVCIHARKDGTLNILTSRGDSRFYPEYFSGNASTKWFSEPPKIMEKPVSFDAELTLELEVRKISKKSIKIELSLNDGTERSSVLREKLDRDEDGSVTVPLWGGEILISPVDKKTFTASQKTPFASTISQDDERIVMPFAMYVN